MDDLYERRQKMKYDVGDKIRIKSREWYNNKKNVCGDIEFGDDIMTEDMSQFVGHVATIVGISEDGAYGLDIDNGYYAWLDWMFEDEPVRHTNWEQRRYEVAKELYVHDEHMNAKTAIGLANDLIHELKAHLNDEVIQ